MIVEPILLCLGIFGLIIGSDVIVAGARHLAARLGISEAVIGLTIVAIGTSIPEITTSILSGLTITKGIQASGIAFGTIIGSNISLMTIVFGTCALAAKNIRITHPSLYRDGIVIILAEGALLLSAIDGRVSSLEGMVLVGLFLAYLLFLLLEVPSFLSKQQDKNHLRILRDLLFIALGSVLVWYSAKTVVDNGLIVARLIHVPSELIGLGIGLGSSLPELSVSLVAMLRRAGDLSVGNLLGSAIVNPLLALGIGATVTGFSATAYDLWVLFPFLLFSSTLCLLILFSNKKINRLLSTALILFYLFFAYLVVFVL